MGEVKDSSRNEDHKEFACPLPEAELTSNTGLSKLEAGLGQWKQINVPGSSTHLQAYLSMLLPLLSYQPEELCVNMLPSVIIAQGPLKRTFLWCRAGGGGAVVNLGPLAGCFSAPGLTSPCKEGSCQVAQC